MYLTVSLEEADTILSASPFCNVKVTSLDGPYILFN